MRKTQKGRRDINKIYTQKSDKKTNSVQNTIYKTRVLAKQPKQFGVMISDAPGGIEHSKLCILRVTHIYIKQKSMIVIVMSCHVIF